jgi:hypothetical protein
MPFQLVKRAALVVESLEPCEPDASTRVPIFSKLARVFKFEIGTARQVFELVACFTSVVDMTFSLNVDSVRRA